MGASIEEIFEANSMSVVRLLGEAGDYFGIPAFQRQYSWGSEQINRLVSDVIYGLRGAKPTGAAVTFIGAVIAVRDSDRRLITRTDSLMRPTVFAVIDGQQRCCTLALWAIVLSSEIAKYRAKLNDGECRLLDSLLPFSQFQGDLDGILFGARRGVQGKHRLYPRIIREPEDRWSTRSTEAIYRSPISSALFQAIEWCEAGKQSAFTYQVPGELDADRRHFKVMQDAISALRLATEYFAERCLVPGSDVDDEPDQTLDVCGRVELQSILHEPFQPDQTVALQAALANGATRGEPYLERLLRLILLGRYLLSNVAVTFVVAKAEDHAFAMFDSLNTTGEPLTPFETFRPRVFLAKNAEDHAGNALVERLSKIEELIPPQGKEKEGFSEELLIALACYLDGRKQPARRSALRAWINEQWPSLHAAPPLSFTQQIQFLDSMRATAEVLSWIKDPHAAEDYMHAGSERLAIEYLHKTSHTTAVPVLAPFVRQVLLASDRAEREIRRSQLQQSARAVFAFSVLWRAAKGGTAGIDGKLREILSGSAHAPIGLSWRARSQQGGRVEVAELLSQIRQMLEAENLLDGARWARRVAEHPLGKSQKQVARVLLAAAGEDVVPDTARPGFMQEGLGGVSTQLSNDADWWKDEHQIEHVAPQDPEPGHTWADSIYEDDTPKHLIGNLTLLPGWVNASIGNRGWERKQLVFQMLAATTAAELDLIKQRGLEVAKAADNKTADFIVSHGRHLHLARALGSVESWTLDFIQSRSLNLGAIAHKRLLTWCIP